MSEERENVSRHILPTAANLLGLCFVIFSIVKVNSLGDVTLLDDITAIAMGLFLISCLFSYASIRGRRREAEFERIADLFFLAGLSVITLVSIIFVLKIVR